MKIIATKGMSTLTCYDDEHTPHDFHVCDGFVSRVVSAVFQENHADARRVAHVLNNQKGLIALLEELEEYFDQRADAEYLPHSATPQGNEEMRWLGEVREALAIFTKREF